MSIRHLLLTLPFALLLALAAAAPQTARAADDVARWEIGDPCPDVILVGARGSGQERDGAGNFTPDSPTLGLGAEVHNLAGRLTRILEDRGVTLAAYANPYPAVSMESYFDPDRGLFWAVDDGRLSTRVIVSVVANQCGDDTEIVLAGFSQGAWVAREGAAFVQAEHRDRIAAVVLIADPQFDPEGGGSVVGGPTPGKGGILGRVPVAGFLAPKTVHVCRAGDVVCQSETTRDMVAYGLGGGTVIHTTGYKGFEMGFAAAVIAASRILGGTSDGGSGAGVALIVDSSGSMSSNDPGNRRHAASRAFLNAATGSDQVGLVDFDELATVLSEARNPVTERDPLLAAIDLIDSSGGTNLGAGLAAGCGVLERASLAGPKAAIFLTDGEGSYSNEAQCFASQGWPVFSFGLGPWVNQALLESISAQTGGVYRQLSDATDLVCEFQQIRAAIAGGVQGDCTPTGTIEQGQLLSLARHVVGLLRQITFTVTWPGSDVEMTLVSPSGRRVERGDSSSDVAVDVGAGFQTTTITNPEAGDWTVELFGADIPLGGEPFTLSSVSLPGRNQDPVPSFSASRRAASQSEWSFDAGASGDADGTIIGYLWSFGDGEIGEGVSPTHTFARPGDYTVSLTVIDDQGSAVTAERELTVDPAAPAPTSLVAAAPTGSPGVGIQRFGRATAAPVAVVRGGNAFLRLRCRGLDHCQGSARLLARLGSRRALGRSPARRVPRTVIGRSPFSISPGRTVTLGLRLAGSVDAPLRSAGRRGLPVRLAGPGVKSRVVRLRSRAGG